MGYAIRGHRGRFHREVISLEEENGILDRRRADAHTRDRVVEKTCVRKHVVKIEPHEEIGWTHKVQIIKDFKRYASGVRLYHAEGRAVETLTNGKLENV